MSQKTKRYLMLVAAIGVLAVIAGGSSGTFAGFNAVVANNNNTFATGTLFLHATHGGTTCASESATDNVNITNIGGTCSALFSVNLTSATSVQEAQLTLNNAGSLDSNDIKFMSPGCTDGNGTLTAGSLSQDIHTTDTGLALLHVNALTYGLQSGVTITVDDGTHTDTFTTATAAPAGATTISVSPHTPAFNFLAATPTNVKFAPSFGAGTLCSGLQFSIVETDSLFHDTSSNHALGCAYGPGVDGTTNGCTFSSGAGYTVATLPSSMAALTLSNQGGNQPTGLNAGQSRYFLVRISPPSGGGLDNTYQNKTATFNLRWQIDQA